MNETLNGTESDNQLYEIIKRHGYRIDVREVYPILIKGGTSGVAAQKFPTWRDALQHALNEIRGT